MEPAAAVAATATDHDPVPRKPGPGLREVALIYPGFTANAAWVVVSIGEAMLTG